MIDGNVDLNRFNKEVSRPGAFTGATGDTRGDKDGTNAAFTLFTVTGEVLVRIFGVCTTDLTGASGTVEVGITGNINLLIAQTTATGIDATELWFDSSPAIGDTLANIPGPFVIPNGLDIIETSATTDIASGQIHYICLWNKLSEDGNVVSAGNDGFT